MVSAFFSLPAASPAELQITGLVPEEASQWPTKHYILTPEKWEFTRLQAAMTTLESAGLLRELQVLREQRYVQVSFRYPQLPEDVFGGKLHQFFTKTLPKAIAPYRCEVRNRGKWGFSISISSGHLVSLEDSSPSFSQSGGTHFPYKDIRPVLDYLVQAGLISSLACSDPQFRPVRISFTYTHPAVRDCLLDAGSSMKLYLLQEARQQFEDVRLGGRSGPDLILTRGQTTLSVCTCMTAPTKEVLFGARYLADRISPAAIPVIACAPDPAGTLPEEIRTLSRTLGVTLLSAAESGQALGKALRNITG